MKERPFIILFLSLIASAGAVDVNTTYTDDPYLAYRPPFVRSLPVQIMLTGVVLTLVAVLFIHLLFTAKYHWSLAPVNYILQISGVTTLLISLIATIHVVLSSSFAESEKWPYMLSYIAVNVPPLDLDANTEGWTSVERATWLVMTASTSVLIQITHIQFLTLLYPSRLEGRLIFALLGPLAIVAATMQLLLINYDNYLTINAIAVRNVCNATLSLLFTSSLFIWGLLVNRKQAWRTDGGTAIFGGAALALALVSTALNFLYVHKENEFVWLPGLMWAVVLWQSFLGWWWWVGAGSGSGFATEDESMAEKLRREAKRASRKREAREKREVKKIKAQKVWQDVTAAFVLPNTPQPSLSQIRSRIPFGAPHRAIQASSELTDPHTALYFQNSNHPISPSSGSQSGSVVGSEPNSSISASESMSRSNSITNTSNLSFPRTFAGVINKWYTSLRHAHVTAARQQTAERVHRIQELDKGVDRRSPWGGFAWRKRMRVTPSMNETMTKSEDEDDQDPQMVAEWRTMSFGEGIMPVSDELEGIRNHQNLRTDHDCQDTTGSDHEMMPHEQQNDVTTPLPVAVVRPSSMSWWGPLRRWRLQDSTVY